MGLNDRSIVYPLPAGTLPLVGIMPLWGMVIAKVRYYERSEYYRPLVDKYILNPGGSTIDRGSRAWNRGYRPLLPGKMVTKEW